MQKLVKQEKGQFIKKRREAKTHTTLNSNFQFLNSNSGITLIALVVTIVVLLILATITINLVLADDGIFGKAEEASEVQKMAEIEEKVGLMLADWVVEKAVYGTDLYTYLEEQRKDGKLDKVTDNRDKDGTILVETEGYEIIVYEDGGMGKAEKLTGIAPVISEPKLYQENGAELVAGKKYEKVVINIQVENHNEFTKIEITMKNAYGETINEATSLTGVPSGQGYYSFIVTENGKYTITVKGTTEEGTRTRGTVANVEGKIKGVDVSKITLSEETLAIDEGKTNQLIATVEPENAEEKNVTWKSEDTSIVTVSTEESTSGTAITITGVKAGSTTITATAKDGSGITASCAVTVQEVESDWELLSKIAKEISNNSNTITKDLSSATVIVEGKSYTLNVGETYKVRYTDEEAGTSELKTVRIIGFNHDELKDTGAYEETNTYAGISFDFVDFLTGTTYMQMNTSQTNVNGWAATQMRKDLNGYTTSDVAQNSIEPKGERAKLSNSTYIKQVKKAYLPNYNSSTVSTTPSEDYLWLLSCAEIWSSGYNGGVTRGWAIGTEGNQYKWYAEHETGYSTANGHLVKKADKSSAVNYWWFRSPRYGYNKYFCIVNTDGSCHSRSANGHYGVAPGFCI